MKKIISITLMLVLSFALYAQDNVTKFLGIPVDGSKASMIQKLKAKGFTYDNLLDRMEGEFNGHNVNIYIATNNNKVWRIAVIDKYDTRDEGQIKIKYNTLCRQFENNPNYISISSNELSESEDISYEITVHNKQYEAAYFQMPADTDAINRSVWFKINEEYGKYSIIIFYDNVFNRANGEDL